MAFWHCEICPPRQSLATLLAAAAARTALTVLVVKGLLRGMMRLMGAKAGQGWSQVVSTSGVHRILVNETQALTDIKGRGGWHMAC